MRVRSVPPLVPLALALAALLVGGPPMTADAQVDPPPTGFEVGQPFPVLTLPSLEDGQPRSLAEFRGHEVILHVFASW